MVLPAFRCVHRAAIWTSTNRRSGTTILPHRERDPLRATQLVLIHEGPTHRVPGAGGVSLRLTTCNIMFLYVGMGLLSMHFAVHQGGWVSLLALAAAVAVFGFSAHLMVWAFDLLPPGVPQTYPELGKASLLGSDGRTFGALRGNLNAAALTSRQHLLQAAFGTSGTHMALVMAFIELAGTACVLLIIIWQLIQLFLPSHGLFGLSALHAAAVLSTAVLVTLLFVPLRRLAWLSMVGSSASLTVTAVVVSLSFVDPHQKGMHQARAEKPCVTAASLLSSVTRPCTTQVSNQQTSSPLPADASRLPHGLFRCAAERRHLCPLCVRP